MKKYNGWDNLPTLQFKEIISELSDAKEEQKALMLIADTGVGKTNCVKLFREKRPQHTYVVTIGDSHNLQYLLLEIMDMLNLRKFYGKNSKYLQLRSISGALNDIGAAGGRPIIILDEAENAKVPTLKAIKELYDAIHDNCAIVLIGTHQLIDSMNKKSSGQSIPQLRRRFKAGTRFISRFNKARDMKAFFDLHIPQDADLQDLLIKICDNYGELHDFLHPYLKWCTKTGKPTSVDTFRLYHKLPKTT